MNEIFLTVFTIRKNKKLIKRQQELFKVEKDYYQSHKKFPEVKNLIFLPSIAEKLSPYLESEHQKLPLLKLFIIALENFSTGGKSLLKTKKTDYHQILDIAKKLQKIPVVKAI